MRTQCVNYIKKNYKDIEIYNKIDQIKKKFDVITMFHVLEHIPHQVDTLKKIRNNLKKKGKIFIEVPSANDLLLDINLSNSFKNFTFWSEHLILHTEKSLTKILKAAGFKNIKIFFFQRYNFNNHINWFLMGKPGGHIYKKKFGDNKIIDEYTKFLKRKKKTDTLIAVAINK